MKRANLAAFLAAAAIALTATGCGHDIEDVCKDLSDACADVVRDECIADAEKLQNLANQGGCASAFDDYLDCVAAPACQWEKACSTEKAALTACTGAFPP